MIAAEDLHHAIAPRSATGEADRIHGGLGARVHETPAGEAPTRCEVLSNDVGVLGWCSEVRAESDAPVNGLGDDWMRMPLHHAADAVMHVEVLAAIDVPDVLPLSAVKVDRPRRALLVARRDATNE